MVFSQSYEKPSQLGYVLWPPALHDYLVFWWLSQCELFPSYPQPSCITITCTSPSLRLAYLTRVWMHLLGSINTLLNPFTHELLYLSTSLRSALYSSLQLSRPPPGRERCKMEIKHLTGCLEKTFKIGCFRFHNLAPFEDQDADMHPSTLGGRKIMEYKAPH